MADRNERLEAAGLQPERCPRCGLELEDYLIGQSTQIWDAEEPQAVCGAWGAAEY
jgi:hypothetical protein